MENVAAQVHGKFKVFSAPLDVDRMLGSLTGEVESWVRSSNVAPKSIGVEYIEAAGRIVLSIGYRDDEPGYAVDLQTLDLGRIEGFEGAELTKIEEAMSSASARLRNVICHELFVTDRNDLRMVFMVQAA